MDWVHDTTGRRLTPEQAVQIAGELYDGHPAAAALILEACQGLSEERRYRSSRALEWLDPLNELPQLSPREDAVLRALRWVIYGHRREDRVRAARDVVRLLRELA
jgi:hypothetical protein